MLVYQKVIILVILMLYYARRHRLERCCFSGGVCVCGLLTVMFVLYAAQDLQHNDDLICCKQNCSGITTKVEICRDDQADVFDWFNTKPNYLSKWDDHRRRSPGLG